MLNDVNSNINNSLGSLGAALLSNTKSANITNVSNAIKNAYVSDAKKTDLVDQGQISDEAMKKYEAEKEMAYYKDLLSKMMGSDEPKSDNISSIMRQVKDGTYNVSNSDLADSMMSNTDLLDLLS